MNFKVKKRSGEIVDFHNANEEYFDPYIKTKDVIKFKCEKCGSDGSRESKNFERPFVYNSFWCKSCRVSEYQKNNKEEIKEKREKTNLEKYGNKNTGFMSSAYGSFKNKDVLEKANNAFKEKYSVSHPSKSKEILQTKTNRYLEKTGYSHHMKNPNLSKAKSFFGTKEFKNLMREKHFEDLKCFKESEITPLFTVDNYSGSKVKKYDFSCNKCGNKFSARIENGNKIYCKKCNPVFSGYSRKEKAIVEIVKRYYAGEIIENYKDELEIDIYIPGLNLGIEYDGAYWHSEKFKDKNYHVEKNKMFKEKGIQLVHIFENDKLEFIEKYIEGLILNKGVEKIMNEEKYIFNSGDKTIINDRFVLCEFEKEKYSVVDTIGPTPNIIDRLAVWDCGYSSMVKIS